MITGGEDPLYIARRLVVVASEDVGLADNHALPLVCRHPRFVFLFLSRPVPSPSNHQTIKPSSHQPRSAHPLAPSAITITITITHQHTAFLTTHTVPDSITITRGPCETKLRLLRHIKHVNS